MFDILKSKLQQFTKSIAEKVLQKKDFKEEAKPDEPVSFPVQSAEPAAEEIPAAPEEIIPAASEEIPAETEPSLPELSVPEKRELKAEIGVAKKIVSFVAGGIELSGKDIEDLLFEFELSLLEADVDVDAVNEIVSNIKKSLSGKKIQSGKDINSEIKSEIRKILSRVMHVEYNNVLELIDLKQEKPFVILFLGPNGAGKTTSIAKLCHLLQSKGKKIVLSASDTFRAASIEQLSEHAKRLKVRVIKHSYGSDPAAVAFDAVQAAKSSGSDVVLIDSAGRQETNKNLMEELKKISRVIKPDLKIYVGEALAGRTLLQQAKEFDSALGLDGFILTKIDADAKGGTTISLLHSLKKPVFFIGTGQEYNDFIEFRPEFILDRII